MNISEYENNLISNIIKSIEKHGGKKLLSSIILTGSFGRKEPTYSIKENGLFFLKSDIEIALICQKNIYRKQINQLIKNVSAEFNEDLNLMQLSEKRVKKRIILIIQFLFLNIKLYLHMIYLMVVILYGEKIF